MLGKIGKYFKKELEEITDEFLQEVSKIDLKAKYNLAQAALFDRHCDEVRLLSFSHFIF